MSKIVFEAALKIVLKHEGGYVNHPDDRGGATNLGVTQRVFDKYQRSLSRKPKSVRHMTDKEAYEIYKHNYWKAMDLDICESEQIAICLFDQAVNTGLRSTTTRVQRVLKMVPRWFNLIADGRMGPKTMAAINNLNEEETLLFLAEFFKASQQYYVAIVKRRPNQIVFLRGWLNRSYNLLAQLWEAHQLDIES